MITDDCVGNTYGDRSVSISLEVLTPTGSVHEVSMRPREILIKPPSDVRSRGDGSS